MALLGYLFIPYFVISIKPVLKKDASKFLRKCANWSSLIAPADIIVGTPLFSRLLPTIAIVLEQRGAAVVKLPRAIEDI
jgi:hypothetical protein